MVSKFDTLYEEVMRSQKDTLDESFLSKTLDLMSFIGRGLSFLKKHVTSKKKEDPRKRQKGIDLLFVIDEYMGEASEMLRDPHMSSDDKNSNLEELENESAKLLGTLGQYLTDEEIQAFEKEMDKHYEKIREKLQPHLTDLMNIFGKDEPTVKVQSLINGKSELSKETKFQLLRKLVDEWRSLKGVDLGTKIAYVLLTLGLVKNISFE